MESITILRKVGGSMIVTVPKKIIDVEGLVPGQIIKINVEKIRKSGFGALKGIRSFTKEDKRWIEGKHYND